MANEPTIEASNTPSDVQAVGRTQQPFVQRISEYKKSPLLFVLECIRPTIISTDQKAFLEAAGSPNAHVSAATGTTVGITAACAWLNLWFISCHAHGRCLCTASTVGQITNVLWPEIAKWHLRMDTELAKHIVVEPDRVFLSGARSECFAFHVRSGKGTAEYFQGFFSENLLFMFCDPAGIPQENFDATVANIQDDSHRWICAGAPVRGTGPFFDTHHKQSNSWKTLRMSSLDSPFCDSRFAKRIADEYGKRSNIYRVRVLGKFPLNHKAQDRPTPE